LVLFCSEQRARFDELETFVPLGQVKILLPLKQEDCLPASHYHPYFWNPAPLVAIVNQDRREGLSECVA